MTELRFKRLPNGEGLPLPAYATAGAAGMDIVSAESFYLANGDHGVVKTGFAIEVPPGYEVQCRPRSGLAAKNAISIVNSPGTIDEDYRGEVMIILINHGQGFFHATRGDRIAQLVLAPVTKATVVEVEELSETQRGANGFGSTGIRS
jgi:dUTP pyrophosphatase